MSRSEQLLWIARTTILFLLGVVPATLSICLLVGTFLLFGPVLHIFSGWFSAMLILAVLGVIGLWSATFQDAGNRILPVGLTVVLLCCGLLAAGPTVVGMMSSALEDTDFGDWGMVALLACPVLCTIYYFVELAVRRLTGEPKV